MLWKWYRKRIQNFLFRKLLFWVSVSLVLVFLSLGLITHYSFYNLLEDREQQLLDIRTKKFSERFADTIQRFNEAVSTFYTEDTLYNNELIPKYKFLETIPLQQDSTQQFVQENYFVAMLNLVKRNSPEAVNLLIYRTEDNKWFSDSNRTNEPLDRSFDFRAFFKAFPEGERYPMLGNSPSYILNIEGPIPYIVMPIYHIESNYNPIIGYILMTFSPDTLTRMFHADSQEESRLIVKQQGMIWLDSGRGSPVPGASQQDYIHSSIRLDASGLDILGFKDKQTIQSNLSSILVYMSLILGLAVAICVFLIANLQRLTVRRLIRLGKHFNRVRENPFSQPMKVTGGDEISHLVIQFNAMTEQLREHIQSVYVAELQKRNAEYYSLKMQINPHFLYNTLESIRMLAVIQNQPVISEKLHHMGHLYRWILKTDKETIPVEEEIRYTDYYIRLSSMGYSNPICLLVDSGLDLRSCQMLKFSLQPIVENAIKHGQLDMMDEPEIRIGIVQEADSLLISISNNGLGLTELELQKVQQHIASPHFPQEMHLGLKNIHERIRSFYGDDYGLSLNKPGPHEGFGITMKLPFQPKENAV